MLAQYFYFIFTPLIWKHYLNSCYNNLLEDNLIRKHDLLVFLPEESLCAITLLYIKSINIKLIHNTYFLHPIHYYKISITFTYRSSGMSLTHTPNSIREVTGPEPLC